MPPAEVNTLHLSESIDALARTNATPSLIESTSILDALVRPQEKIQEVRAMIAKKQKELEGLIMYEGHLVREIKPYQGLLSPFRRIPQEILGEIFIACLPHDHAPVIDIREPPLLLTRISSHLRQVALSTPRLWTRINIPIIFPCLTGWRDGRDESREEMSWRIMRKYTMFTDEWLGRTGACPVEISVHEFGSLTIDHHIQGLLEIIIALAGRWKCLSLHCSGSSIRRFCAMLRKSYSEFDFPVLQRLCLDVSGLDSFMDDPQEEYNYASHLPHASSLHSLRLVLPEDNYEGYHCRWSHLTHLSLGSALHPASLDSIVKTLKPCINLVKCKLHVKMDNTHLYLRLPYLKSLSLFFDPKGWFDATAGHPGLLGSPMLLCNNLDMPLLERMAYDASTDFLPLLGLLHRAGDHITHLSVAHFEVPMELIECLKACPRLLSLDVMRPDGMPKARRRQSQQFRPAQWPDSLLSWTTAGNQLLRYLMGPGNIDGVQTQLCPDLEHLAYHINDGPLSYEVIEAFILDKSQKREGARLKTLSAFVFGGQEIVEYLRKSVEEQVLAGLRLRLLPGGSGYKYMEHSTYPVMRQLEWWDDDGNTYYACR